MHTQPLWTLHRINTCPAVRPTCKEEVYNAVCQGASTKGGKGFSVKGGKVLEGFAYVNVNVNVNVNVHVN